MRILSCASVQRRLHAWHDGELPPADHCAVEHHLAGCPPCASDARALQRIGALIRDSAAARALSGDEAAGMRSGVLARRKAEDAMSWTSQFGELFDDMHLVWAGLSATAATAICLVLLLGIAYLTPAERADSLSGLMSTMGAGPSASRAHADAVSAGFAGGVSEGDLVLALAAVVTQEGHLVPSGGLRLSRQDREVVLQLMDAVAAARFQSPRPDGERLTVNVVWRDGPRLRLLQHMTVQGKATLS